NIMPVWTWRGVAHSSASICSAPTYSLTVCNFGCASVGSENSSAALAAAAFVAAGGEPADFWHPTRMPTLAMPVATAHRPKRRKRFIATMIDWGRGEFKNRGGRSAIPTEGQFHE